MNFKEFSLKYQHILIIGLGFLGLSYVLIYISDIKNFFGTREIYADTFIPLLWNRLFTEGGPIEMLQWLFLGLLIIFSAYLTGILRERKRGKEAMFWLLFAVAGMFMLMEDAGDLRDYLFYEQLGLSFFYLRIAETFYFLVLAAIPIFAVIKYGKYIKKSKVTVILLALGFIFYGAAAFISGPADLIDGGWYIGGVMYNFTTSKWMGGDELKHIYEKTDLNLLEDDPHNLNVTYRLKDFLLEESLELLGATMLLASAVSYLQFIQIKKHKKRKKKAIH